MVGQGGSTLDADAEKQRIHKETFGIEKMD